MKVFIANTGPWAPREYYLLFCRTCQSGFEWLKALLKQVLGSKPTVFTLIWDCNSLKIFVQKIDFVGCSLVWDADVEVGPNARQLLWEPSEHVDVSHIYTKEFFFFFFATNKRKSHTAFTGPLSSIKKPKCF